MRKISLKKRMGQLLSGIMAAALLVQPMAAKIPKVYAAEQTPAAQLPAVQAEASGTAYYFSSTKGSDSNDGSLEKPFQSLNKIQELELQPGDRLLLERGSIFDNQYIHLENVGDISGDPILIEPYGEGTERPRINANGTGVWYQSYGVPLPSTAHKWQGNVSSAILLTDVENIEIRGLEITNWVETEEGGLEFKDPSLIDRTGVAGVAKNRGTLDHIVLEDLYVHDVKGNIINKHMLNGGIYFASFLPDGVTSNTAAIAEEDIPRYNDLVIEGCHVEDVSRWGIAAAYTAYHNKMQTLKAIPDEICETWGSTNVVMRNNYVKDVGGDGITPMHCFRPIVESNVCQSAAKYISTDYFPNGTHRVAAGIWPWKCKDAVFRRNECFDMLNYIKGNNDAQAWDADWADGTLYEYNYSHGNSGGCVMFCGSLAYRSTFRYNISQNDERGMICIPGNPDAHIYNNTFYIKEGVPVIPNDFGNGVAKVENNIFYYAGSTPGNGNWHPNNSNVVFNNNIYYNYADTPAEDTNAISIAAGADEIFVDPGKAPSLPQTSQVVYDLSVFEGYKLAEGSPAVGAGKLITDDNGFALGTDFFGVELNGLREIGAVESEEVVLRIDSEVYTVTTDGYQQGTANTIAGLAADTTLEEFQQNILYDRAANLVVKDEAGAEIVAGSRVSYPMTVELSYHGETIAYEILPDQDAALYSTVYKADATNLYVPSTTNNPCTVKELLQGIEVADTARATVLSGTAEVTEGVLNTGMKLKITAEDGVHTTEYRITIQNEYHWIKDYVDAQQGNVWFAQVKDDTGVFRNAASYNSTYAVWDLGESYTTVGAQGNKGQVDETKHGVICDWRPGAPTPAMVFRVPKDGVIRFALKSDEPYLRQGNNSGGTARVDLFVNEEAEPRQTSGEMSVVNQKADFEAVEIEVRKGDYIRLVAQSTGTPSSPSIFATPIITYLDVMPADTEAPTSPAKVTAQEITWNSAKLSWTAANDNMGIEKYEIYQGTELVASVAGTVMEASLTDLEEAAEYMLEVFAVDAAGNRSEAAVVQFTTVENIVPYQQQLRQQVEQAKAKIAEDKYTEETVAKVREEIKKANTLVEEQTPAKADLEQAIQALTGAVAALEEKTVNPDPNTNPNPEPEAVSAPVFAQAAGTYEKDLEITITSPTEGSIIYYTTDGTAPTAASTKYTKAIKINRKTTIRAIAIKGGMADSKVVEAAYVIDRGFPFTDVEQNRLWKHESVKYVWDNSIMNGISGTTEFRPDYPLTRSMFATVLYRMAGSPAVEFKATFPDVKDGQWYSDAIIWANQKGIVQGLGDGSYGINENITREQIAKMLCEYAETAGYDISEVQELSTFTDEKDVSGWAVGYMKWATAVKMITGKPNEDGKTYRMDPKGQATRAECAAMLMRFENKYLQ